MSAVAKPRGLAALSPERRREIAAIGGRAVSQNRAHMSEIGRKGGIAISSDREYMATIARPKGANTAVAGRL